MFDELKRKMNRFWNDDRTLEQTDPDYIEVFSHFAYDEVVNEPAASDPELDDRLRSLAIAAALLGAQGLDAFTMLLPVMSRSGLESPAIKELIYQATAYIGFAGALPFLKAMNLYLNAANVAQPFASATTVDRQNREQAGAEKQVEIFGEHMQHSAQHGSQETAHIRRWLTANCFGDYYTRAVLTTRERELATLCMLTGLGSAEQQIKAHVAGNLHIGNSRQLIIAVLSQLVPYIGYPRVLNALSCLPDSPESADSSDTDSSATSADSENSAAE
ncbi:carboxymuconolactone decarboxylase [Bifidobacterium dolichotidis]|uniref:Carboxymuconolactone decarboxylase n=1 Tax=Bifidobacterium dolichotidis TaxID=2306976 RepID=A0A430FT34_9BIFI|nr:carboxymuconolactone decarboxylase family protein [Bifidobacterium dolichotidis]RSX56011.1 carboxymuconolactone decarboxylase [Bifidobacterium dolichotidis]